MTNDANAKPETCPPQVEAIVIRSDKWYVIPRECNSTAALYFSVALVRPSSSAGAAWSRFLDVFGDTKKEWKKKGHVARKVRVQWSCDG